MRAAVVDDDVGDRLDVELVARGDELAQLGLGAVLAVELVQVARQVALIGCVCVCVVFGCGVFGVLFCV